MTDSTNLALIGLCLGSGLARRQLLSNKAWAARLAPAVDDREVIRHYTLSEDDFDVVMRKRLDKSRLGYALALCLMRHPGRSLEQGEALPVQIVGYVARQSGIAPGVFDNSPDRDKERRKHLAEATRRFGYRAFDRAVLKDLMGWLTPSAQVTRAAEPLIDMMIDELRRRQILLPSPGVLELVVHQDRHRGEPVIHEALIGTLSVERRVVLDALLAIRPETTVTQLAWLQNASRSPAARNIPRLIERLQVIREFAVDRRLAERVPPLVFDRLAAERRRMTAQDIRDLTTGRRHAVLIATVGALETELTDATLFMFDKLMGSLARRWQRIVSEPSQGRGAHRRSLSNGQTRSARHIPYGFRQARLALIRFQGRGDRQKGLRTLCVERTARTTCRRRGLGRAIPPISGV